MTNDITGFGTRIWLVASPSFPTGIPVTQFADDANPLEFAAVQMGDTAMGVNGDLISWSKAVTLPMVLNIIPGTLDDEALQQLANNNRPSQGRNSVRDIITVAIVYPDGSRATLSGGKIVNAQFAKGITSAGRMSTKSYAFSFQDMV